MILLHTYYAILISAENTKISTEDFLNKKGVLQIFLSENLNPGAALFRFIISDGTILQSSPGEMKINTCEFIISFDNTLRVYQFKILSLMRESFLN